MTDLKSEKIVGDFRKRPSATVISLVLVILFGVIDSFTSKIVPTIVEVINDYWDPPTVTINLPEPVQLDKDSVQIRKASTEPTGSVSSKFEVISPRTLVVHVAPGTYIIALRRMSNGQIELANAVLHFEKSGESVDLKISPSDWRNPDALTADISAPSEAPPGQPATPVSLAGTRWKTTGDDFAVLATVSDNVARSMLGLSLLEVGVDEHGPAPDKARIKEYWQSVPSWKGNTDNIAWSGAFLSWVASSAGVVSPQSAAHMAWLNWGSSTDKEHAKPGMVAIFKRASGAPSNLVVGVILRVQPDCVEVIGGNFADHVSISCVGLEVVDVRVPPRRVN